MLSLRKLYYLYKKHISTSIFKRVFFYTPSVWHRAGENPAYFKDYVVLDKHKTRPVDNGKTGFYKEVNYEYTK